MFLEKTDAKDVSCLKTNTNNLKKNHFSDLFNTTNSPVLLKITISFKIERC